MRLFLLCALTMIAFAANSVLNRLAVADGAIGPATFGAVRLAAGAAALALLCVMARGGLKLGGPARGTGVIALLVYIFGFSLAYEQLDAGLGALVLFGTVQLTMFGAGLWQGERPPALRWIGSAVSALGLVWLLWPTEGCDACAPLSHLALMVAAGVGWGAYSLAGRKATDALQATAANFVLAVPLGAAILLLLPISDDVPVTTQGIVLAIIAGAVTSGLGYALWYTVLPRLSPSTAAVTQLTVPAIATLGGIVFLAERLTPTLLAASFLILGGVAVATLGPANVTKRSSGS